MTTQRSPYTLWILLALAIIFIGPMVAAWSLYTAKNNWLEERVNYGQLIQPPLDLTQLSLVDVAGKSLPAKTLRGQWLLIYTNQQACDKNCQDKLFSLQQLWLALGKNMDRVQRVYLSPLNNKKMNAALQKKFPGMQVFSVKHNQFNHLFVDSKTAPDSTTHIYLADPLGNLMMVYNTDTKPKAIYSDLSRLLSVSQVG